MRRKATRYAVGLAVLSLALVEGASLATAAETPDDAVGRRDGYSRPGEGGEGRRPWGGGGVPVKNTVTAAIKADKLVGRPSGQGPASSTSYRFTGVGTARPSGASLTYAWDFGDGETGEGRSVSHTYPCEPQKRVEQVELTVTATWGDIEETATAGRSVEVDACKVAPVAPKAEDDEYAVAADRRLSENVLENDNLGNDEYGKPWPLKAVAGKPRFGQVTMSTATTPDPRAGTFAYTPKRRFCGVDTFTYQLRSPAGRTRTQTGATTYVHVCSDVLPGYLKGLADQVNRRDRNAVQLRRLLLEAGRQALSNPVLAVVALRAADELTSDPLLKKGIAHALGGLDAGDSDEPEDPEAPDSDSDSGAGSDD